MVPLHVDHTTLELAAVQRHVEAIVKVLKRRFNNLTAEETIALAFEILRAQGAAV